MDLSNKNFDDVLTGGSNTSKMKQQDTENGKGVPRRVLHFSDGVLEEFDAEEVTANETEGNAQHEVPTLDPSEMSWGPWIWHKTVSASAKTLEVIDNAGEALADFFGITTPKYQFEIDEYHRMVAEEEKEKKKMDLEMGGWTEQSRSSAELDGANAEVTTSPPTKENLKY